MCIELGKCDERLTDTSVEPRPEDIALGIEVIEEARSAHSRALRDLSHRRCFIPLLEKQLACGCCERLSRRSAGAAGARCCNHPITVSDTDSSVSESRAV